MNHLNGIIDTVQRSKRILKNPEGILKESWQKKTTENQTKELRIVWKENNS